MYLTSKYICILIEIPIIIAKSNTDKGRFPSNLYSYRNYALNSWYDRRWSRWRGNLFR